MTSDSKAGVFLLLYAPPLPVSLRNQGQEILIELVTTKCAEQTTGDELLLGIVYSARLLLEMPMTHQMHSQPCKHPQHRLSGGVSDRKTLEKSLLPGEKC